MSEGLVFDKTLALASAFARVLCAFRVKSKHTGHGGSAASWLISRRHHRQQRQLKILGMTLPTIFVTSATSSTTATGTAATPRFVLSVRPVCILSVFYGADTFFSSLTFSVY